ncbi:MAG: NAD(P)/FAD-dependent oxidoreductase [Alphaproteobacteria bacterium]
MAPATSVPQPPIIDVVVVGAGFSGMYMLYVLRQAGFNVVVLEAGNDVGGTWYWNRYPGARCDIDSLAYSYSFDDDLQQEWHWPHRFAYQPEILRYARHVADRFDLRRDIRFGIRVDQAVYDESEGIWTVTADDGSKVVSRFCVMATGCLSVPKVPDIPNLESFSGPVYHTANWPEEGVDFSGRRVGVIGTGSSGIQCIPLIADQADHLTVFQRTPNFNVPSWNAPLSEKLESEVKSNYAAYREKARNSLSADFWDEHRLALLEATPEEQRIELDACWAAGGFDIQYAFSDIFTDEKANEIACAFVHDKIKAIVKDPEVAAKLCPDDHPLGSKRLCVDDRYYQTYNQPNVSLVDLRQEPIETMVAEGVKVGDHIVQIDDLVLATGFDAMTGALTRMDIHGRDGISLRDAWANGPRSYLGLSVAGFPNLFTITGPGSPSVLTNMIVSIEQHVEWIRDCLVRLREQGVTRFEAMEQAQETWVEHVAELADETLFPRANSWYVGANVPGKARVFMAYVAGQKPYTDVCDRIAANDYEGFSMTE